MRKLPSIVFLCLLILSCESEKETKSKSSPRIRKKTSITLPNGNSEVRFGDSIYWEAKHAEEGTIDSLVLEGLDERVVFSGKSGNWLPKTPRAGKPKLKLSVYSNGKKETHYPRLKFLPSELPKLYGYRIINTYPHDPESYIQGFLIHEGQIIESTGQWGKSRLRKIEIESGRVLKDLKLDDQFFGEGCAIFEDKIYQLTYQSKTVLVYDLELNKVNNYPFISDTNEGWGLTEYGQKLLVSDGSDKIYFMNPDGFTEIDRLEIYDNERNISKLNELELIDNLLYANVYGEEYVVIIDLESGAVVGKIDFTGLLPKATQGRGIDYVLNGIAYDEENDRLFVTGKLWNTIFEVELFEKQSI